MTPAAPRALIAEDEPLLAAALQHELRTAWPELQIAATVGDGLSAVQQALALQPGFVEALNLHQAVHCLALQGAGLGPETWNFAAGQRHQQRCQKSQAHSLAGGLE